MTRKKKRKPTLQDLMIGTRFKSNAENRDIMNVGYSYSLDSEDHDGVVSDELPSGAYYRCPHCYRAVCRCPGERQRHSRYSPADYMLYQLSEDDLIACIDLLNSLEEFE